MTRKPFLLLTLGLAVALYGGAALAGHDSRGGVPHPGKGHGHVKHHGHVKGHSRGFIRKGHVAHYSHGRHFGHRQTYRGPRVAHHTRHVTHVHGPHCGHRGYGYHHKSRHYRGYSPHYREQYGRAAFTGYDSGVRYWLEFKY